ncbi:MAG: PrsW family intramembrane metalloprotease [Chloroflexi bacterium]|nr:PrsW family intramembrane metalloprotease [Chloroflexota bacterium]
MALLTAIFLSFASAFLMILFINWLDRYEKEPILLMIAAFLWGVVIAAGGAYIINTVLGIGVYVFTGDEAMADVATVSLIAPFVEEFLKGLAVLIVFFLFRREFDSVLDGIIYAAMVALGFAATENAIYIIRGYDANGWAGLLELAWIRLVVVAWQHPFYTAFTGIGLAVARLNRSILVKLIAIPTGFSLAVFAHFLHNSMAIFLPDILGRLTDWLGWFTMGAFILWMIFHERNLVKKHLAEEVTSGLLTPSQYQSALSPFTMSFAILSGLATHRFYQTCGELAHKKEQFSKLGDESGNAAIIASLRAQLSNLRPQVRG